MKSLIDYLQNAEHYLHPNFRENTEKDRQEAIAYCISRNLEEDFQKAVKELPMWLELAKGTSVKFYIEEPLRQTPGSPHNSKVETGVFLRIYDGGRSPVIKVVM